MSRIHGVTGGGKLTIHSPTGREGRLYLHRDRHGNGWHGAEVGVRGPRGALLGLVILSPAGLRLLAVHAQRTADFIEARDRGHLAPCLCPELFAHGDDPRAPCPADAADDADCCRACWTPEYGMQYHATTWQAIRKADDPDARLAEIIAERTRP